MLRQFISRSAREFFKGFKQKCGNLRYSTESFAQEPSTARALVPKKSRWFRRTLVCAVFAGVGIWVTDMWINDDFDSVYEYWRKRLPMEERINRPKVVIIGSGWGGMSVLRKLHTDKYNVTMVSPNNYFLFTPLLASTTSGLLEERSILESVRRYCNKEGKDEVRFVEMEVTEVDPVGQKVICEDKSRVRGKVSKIELEYDYLVMAPGAKPATFNIPGVEENAICMKTIADSRNIRDRVIDCFETASIPGQSPDEISRLLHFVVVGGGPSGVEYTAELHDFVKNDLKKTYPDVSSNVRISLVEALPKILPMFDSMLIDYVEKRFREKLNIDVWTKYMVNRIEERSMVVKKQDTGEVISIPFGMLVWVTGNSPRSITLDLIEKLGPSFQPTRRGLNIDDHLRVVGTTNIFSIGDCTFRPGYPATAQVASQQGYYLARLFNQYANFLAEQRVSHPDQSTGNADVFSSVLGEHNKFIFKSLGSLAYIGENSAIADLGSKGKSKGFATWILWRSVYLSKLLSLRNRISVLSDWCKVTLFGRDVSRG
ncbi:uncharacterized protein LOC126316430 [Schistocerca gregaria]|uniref:uncharacterized protein LOC126316430 n=1 Tax=Schistocerca gregaria TaxID=7010 RepID=UPI00211EC076|nr:uncharacterized protein LOC126316430 [Schistocerca gregaria]